MQIPDPVLSATIAGSSVVIAALVTAIFAKIKAVHVLVNRKSDEQNATIKDLTKSNLELQIIIQGLIANASAKKTISEYEKSKLPMTMADIDRDETTL